MQFRAVLRMCWLQLAVKPPNTKRGSQRCSDWQVYDMATIHSGGLSKGRFKRYAGWLTSAEMTPTGPAHPLCLMPNHAASEAGFVSAGAAGKAKWNVAPRTSSPLTQIRPLCDSTIDLVIAKPMPLPCGLVVKKRVEYLVGRAHGQPGPCVMNRNQDPAEPHTIATSP
jgi:hypothetical protein